MKIKEISSFKNRNKTGNLFFDFIIGLLAIIGIILMVASWIIAGMFFLYEVIQTKYSFFQILLDTLGVFLISIISGAFIIIMVLIIDHLKIKSEKKNAEEIDKV